MTSHAHEIPVQMLLACQEIMGIIRGFEIAKTDRQQKKVGAWREGSL